MERRTPKPSDPMDDLIRDAARWRALLASERIRVSTEVHQPHSNPIPGSKYIRIEFWSHHQYPEKRMSTPALLEYVDFVIQLQDR